MNRSKACQSRQHLKAGRKMTTELSDVMARRGPGYETDAPASWAMPRHSLGGRLLDSITHSGPGYCPASTEEIAEISAAQRHVKDNIVEILARSIADLVSLKVHLEKLGNGTQSEQDHHKREFETGIRKISRRFDSDWPPALQALKDSVGPLDFRERRLIKRMSRFGRVASGLLADLAAETRREQKAPVEIRTTTPPRRMPSGRPITADQVNRSLVSLLQAAAR
ncbi:hypothetical protein ACIQF6_14990 [Kitasatospora sp. NPDC092948]|uniref:hypothetical protein n=1 Tax=Kitasatospora sp. NPDC092948 TaxID=3364088 RepID=UPI0038229963